jgi:hypothetical protein
LRSRSFRFPRLRPANRLACRWRTARLRAAKLGTTLTAARRDLQVTADRLMIEHPEDNGFALGHHASRGYGRQCSPDPSR